MDQNITVTVGIPIYNAERFLELSIQSVLSQTFRSFELILSDDGSTDNSLHIASSFNDPRIIILSDGKNRGISYRLNEQISLAKGKYFVRMDADDLMFPDRLLKQINILKDNHDIDVVGSYAIVIDDENKIIGLRKSKIPNTIEECFRSVPFIHPTVMGKIEWFKKYRYSPNLKGVEDADLWVRSFSNSHLFLIKEPLLFYRDPLKIKFSTYKFRTFQLHKLYKTNSPVLGNSTYTLCSLEFRSLLKLFIYWILKTVLIERFLLKKRNNHIDKILNDEALSIMNSIIRQLYNDSQTKLNVST
jgi:glycosyltransferase involved in cell wall biosynthesis